ncbi:MAG: phosphotransferase [Pseudomonadota bacterium]
MDDPTERHASAIARELFGAPPGSLSRFPTGMQHFVYDVTMDPGHRIVVRISRPGDIDLAKGAVYWSERLRPLGVPLPEILHVDLEMRRHPFPFIVLERLPGRDLGIVFETLSRSQLQALAAQLIEIQNSVTALPEGAGFGFARAYDDPFPHKSWREVIFSDLARCRRRIRTAGVVAEQSVDTVAAMTEPLEGYLADVRPVPFLHDITTKNVIIDQGRLSGIVDVDDLCFGDPLFLVGLIRVALIAHGRHPGYAQDWVDLLQPDPEQADALDLYTAIHCVGFMSELGNRFNRDEAAPIDPDFLERLRSLHGRLTAGS